VTIKLFWQDPYRTELDTRVAHVSGEQVMLAETILYALHGGQERDHGSIGAHPVLDAAWRGHAIAYTLPPAHGLRAGEAVRLSLDWTRRYRLMRLHFAAELVLEIITRRLAGIEKIGAHIAADKARIDFAWPCGIGAELPAIEQAVQALVQADLAIESAFTDAAAERRCWRIAGFAEVACGGTHPRRTGEVGRLALRRRNLGRGKERIEISLPP
jgi:Ser-tRNA(Ala) deacylase AlaX